MAVYCALSFAKAEEVVVLAGVRARLGITSSGNVRIRIGTSKAISFPKVDIRKKKKNCR